MAESGERTGPDIASKWDASLFEENYIKKLAAQTLSEVEAERERQNQPPSSLAVVALSGIGPASTLGREVEKTVFGQYFGNGIDTLRDEYEAYDRASVFFVAIDTASKTPAGVVRIITPSPAGLKSLNDIASPRYPWQLSENELAARMLPPAFSPDTTIDIATLAVKPEHRPDSKNQLDRVSALLYYAMCQWSQQHGYEQWVGILDSTPLNNIQKLGSPLDFFEGVEAAPYIGSALSIPFYANLGRIDERLARAGLADFFLRGKGIDPSVAFKL